MSSAIACATGRKWSSSSTNAWAGAAELRTTLACDLRVSHGTGGGSPPPAERTRVTFIRRLGSLRHRAIFCLALSSAVACGDDDSAGDGRSPDGSNLGSRDSGLDASRDGSSLDSRTNPTDSATTIFVDAGEAGVITVVRTDGCPADAPLPVNRLRIYPAGGGEVDLRGVQLQGSNEGTTVGFADLGALSQMPKDGDYAELKVENETVYRYVRFFDPEGRSVPLAELEFYHDALKLSGKGFGTVGSAEHLFDAALDGDVSTFYQGQTAGGNYIGLDIAGSYLAETPTFTPAPGALSIPTAISLSTTTPGAEIHYTIDGATPTAASPKYDQPVDAGMTRLNIRAIATAKCHFSSAIANATYGVAGEPVGMGQKSFHLGNSLTDVIDGFLAPVADSTGVTHSFARWTIPGCQISWQANPEHVEDGTAIPEEARHVSSFVQSFKPDHISVQPFTDPTIANEGPAALTFLQPAVAANPNLQAWVYAQWPSTDPTKPETAGRGYLEDELARGADWADWPAPATAVPNTWEDTTDARMRYYEAFADFVDQRLDGKPVLIIPGGSALATLKRRVDAGTFPGITNFFAEVFGEKDDLHLRNNGRYLVALVFYACMYRQNPVEKVTYTPDDVTAEQAAALRQIAWETASSYPRCGIAQ
jgi:hypothetical protein